ncbi:hypothetical protein QFC24_004005 [Naganishia onofrii]|uniref:Uncharacterized protein n=1 Tax=Naganishia onofrii TaxID=1851511 RepID=A0ACC2XI76_9TREE|nr:hypothetical protein QFC24_004005 [Naganishia onofrii]
MARKKPASNKQKKAALQEQRAIKRGDIPAGTPREHTNIKLKPSASQNALPSRSEALGTVDWQARRKARELQSAFTGLSKTYVEAANRKAFNVPLPRPLPPSAVLFRNPVQQETDEQVREKVKELDERLYCPIRPKWRHSMTKKELDRNEEMVFGRWLEEMDATHGEYLQLPHMDDNDTEGNQHRGSGERERGKDDASTTRSPSFFERNLSVWRQLWRVTEQSQIILVMIDVRCPPVHFPASLRSYLRSLVTPVTRKRKELQVATSNNEEAGTPGTPTSATTTTTTTRPKGAPTGRKRVILCLTKTDLVDSEATSAWIRWCKDWWKYGYDTPAKKDDGGEKADETKEEEIEVVSVRSYADQPVEEQKTRHRHIPQIPGSTLNELLEALEKAHMDLLKPPPVLLDQPEKLERWRRECRRSVKEVVNWGEFKQRPQQQQAVVDEHGEEEMVEREAKEGDIVEDDEVHDNETHEAEGDKEAETLTIGLIGQPNCGKSSLLNALMGRSRVRASKTPGKTKHFQSLYWSKDVRIVDCPGLVLPSLTCVEMQVQAGILPISQVSSVASCIYHIACALPLEKALNVAAPARWAEERERRMRIQSRITTRRRDDQEEREDGRRAEPVVCETPVGEREEGVGEERWTAGDILQGWAEYRGYVTAKAGRPDTNRAGNEILRTVVEGRIPWRYLPSTGSLTDSDADLEQLVGSNGIWLPHQTEAAAALIPHDDDDERRGSSEEDTDEDLERPEGLGRLVEEAETGSDTEEEEEEATSQRTGLGAQSRFAALSLGVEEGVSEDDDDDEEEGPVASFQ